MPNVGRQALRHKNWNVKSPESRHKYNRMPTDTNTFVLPFFYSKWFFIGAACSIFVQSTSVLVREEGRHARIYPNVISADPWHSLRIFFPPFVKQLQRIRCLESAAQNVMRTTRKQSKVYRIGGSFYYSEYSIHAYKRKQKPYSTLNTFSLFGAHNFYIYFIIYINWAQTMERMKTNERETEAANKWNEKWFWME